MIDENLPRSFGAIFEKHGFQSLDIRDQGLRGAPDSAVFSFAKQHDAGIVTSDVEFANRVHLFESGHRGVFLLRLPTSLSVNVRCQDLDRALAQLSNQTIDDRIIVIAPGALRIHGRHT